jgi:serine/threonine protein kinase
VGQFIAAQSAIQPQQKIKNKGSPMNQYTVDINTLMKFTHKEPMCPKELLNRLLAAVYPELSLIGLLCCGLEGAVIKVANKEKKIFVLKIASTIFERTITVHKQGIFKYQEIETPNKRRERFLRGAKNQNFVASQLNGGLEIIYIPRVIEVKETPFLCLLMEYVEGSNILWYVRDEKNIDVSIKLYYILLKAIQKIHELDVIHRDLKPENILLTGTSREKPVICPVDWAQSKYIGLDSNISIKGDVFGTLPYASEKLVLSREGWQASFDDDIFSLGVMLWEFYSFAKCPKPEEPVRLVSDKEYREAYYKSLSSVLPQSLQKIFNNSVWNKYKEIGELLFDFEKSVMSSEIKPRLEYDELLSQHYELENRVKNLEKKMQKFIEYWREETCQE